MATAAAVVATSVQAQTITVNGDTTGGPTWNGPQDPGTGFINQCSACPFETINITIVDPGSFRAEIVSVSVGFDTYLHLYQGSFDPSNPLVNLVGVDDDGGAGLLSEISVAAGDGPFTAGPHILVVNGYNNSDFGTYVLELDGVTLGFGPSGTALSDELIMQAAALGFLISDARFGPMGRITADSIHARNADRSATATGTPVNAHKTLNTSHGILGEGIHAWTDFGYTVGRSANSLDSSLAYAQFGLDVSIDPDMVLGMAFGIGNLKSDATGASLDGTGYWIQPYAGFDFDFARGVVSVAVGYNDYDTFTAGTATGTANSLGAAGHLFVAHDVVMGSLVVSPFGQFAGGNERIGDFGGGLAGQPDTNVRYIDSALGVEVAHHFDGQMGAAPFVGRIYGRAEAQYRYSSAPTVTFASGAQDFDGIGAGAAVGFSFDLSDDVSAGIEAGADGLGTDITSYGAKGSLILRF